MSETPRLVVYKRPKPKLLSGMSRAARKLESDGRNSAMSKDATSALAALRAARAANSPFSTLIYDYRVTLALFEDIDDFRNYIFNEDPNFPALEALYVERSKAESDALMAVCVHPISTLDEVRRKADFLLERMEWSEVTQFHFEAFLRSFQD